MDARSPKPPNWCDLDAAIDRFADRVADRLARTLGPLLSAAEASSSAAPETAASLARTADQDDSRLLDENEAAGMLGFTPRFLQARRIRGDRPPFIRISSRAVRYRPSDLRAWLEQRTRTSTSES